MEKLQKWRFSLGVTRMNRIIGTIQFQWFQGDVWETCLRICRGESVNILDIELCQAWGKEGDRREDSCMWWRKTCKRVCLCLCVYTSSMHCRKHDSQGAVLTYQPILKQPWREVGESNLQVRFLNFKMYSFIFNSRDAELEKLPNTEFSKLKYTVFDFLLAYLLN